MNRLSIACLLATCASAVAQSQTIVVPNGAAAAEGNASNQFPWGRGGSGLRMQCIYDSSNFTAQGVTGPISITHLSWRPDAGTPRTWVATSYQTATIQLSTSPLDYAAASTTFGNNSGGDATTVFSGPVSWPGGSSAPPGPAPFLVQIPLATPFLYDPTQGDLNVDIDLPVQAFSGTNLQFDVSTASPQASRVYLSAGYPSGNASFQVNHGVVLGVGFTPVVQAQPIAVDDIVLVRVGDGVTPLTDAAAPVFLDEYTPGGTLVQSIALPTVTVGNQHACTQSGLAVFEGALCRTGDGGYLVMGGYDAPVGTPNVAATSSAAVRRVVARIGLDGSVDTSTALTDAYSGGSLGCVVSPDGVGFWLSGTTDAAGVASGGIRYATLGASTSTLNCSAVPEPRTLGICGGELLCYSDSASNPGIYVVGSGLSTQPGQGATMVDPGAGDLMKTCMPNVEWCKRYHRIRRDPQNPGLCMLEYVELCGWSSHSGFLVTVLSSSQVPCRQSGPMAPSPFFSWGWGWTSSDGWYYFTSWNQVQAVPHLLKFDVTNVVQVEITSGGGLTDLRGVDVIQLLANNQPVGGGCFGSAGVPVATFSLAHLGFPWGITLTNLPFDIGAMVFSLAPGLQLDLGFLGAPGCTLYQSPDFVQVGSGASGTASFTTAIPNNPSLIGLEIRAQGLSLDPVTNTLGWVTSNGVVATVGW